MSTICTTASRLFNGIAGVNIKAADLSMFEPKGQSLDRWNYLDLGQGYNIERSSELWDDDEDAFTQQWDNKKIGMQILFAKLTTMFNPFAAIFS